MPQRGLSTTSTSTAMDYDAIRHAPSSSISRQGSHKRTDLSVDIHTQKMMAQSMPSPTDKMQSPVSKFLEGGRKRFLGALGALNPGKAAHVVTDAASHDIASDATAATATAAAHDMRQAPGQSTSSAQPPAATVASPAPRESLARRALKQAFMSGGKPRAAAMATPPPSAAPLASASSSRALASATAEGGPTLSQTAGAGTGAGSPARLVSAPAAASSFTPAAAEHATPASLAQSVRRQLSLDDGIGPAAAAHDKENALPIGSPSVAATPALRLVSLECTSGARAAAAPPALCTALFPAGSPPPTESGAGACGPQPRIPFALKSPTAVGPGGAVKAARLATPRTRGPLSPTHGQ